MTSTPHDALFKAVFSQPEHAADELRAMLPKRIVEATDWSSLTLEPGSFVDEALTERQSDLRFRAQLSGSEVRYYVLFEHQSEPDANMAFRLLRYMIRIWENLPERGGKFIPIIPLVLSHSVQGWTAKTSFHDLFELEDLKDLAPFIPSFRYLVDDLQQATNEDFARRSNSHYALAALQLLRDARRLRLPEVLMEVIEHLRALDNQPDEAALNQLLVYSIFVSDADESTEIQDVFKLIGPVTKDNMMPTLVEKWIARGRIEGEARGRVGAGRNLLRNLLRLKFGPLDDETEARIEAESQESALERWSGRILTAQTLGEVFDER